MTQKSTNVFNAQRLKNQVVNEQILERPGITIRDVIGDVAPNITYLFGIVLIEMYIKPLFGNDGVPLIPNCILVVSEIYLLVKLLWKLFKLIDAFIKDIFNSNLYTKIYSERKIRSEITESFQRGSDEIEDVEE